MTANFTQQAVALHRANRLAEAETLYRQALAADGRDFTARHLLGVLQAQTGRADEALATLEAALALRPGDADALLNRANVLVSLGRRTEALAGFDAALAARPGWPQALNSRGSLLQELKRPAEALESYDRALAAEPGFTAALNNRGSALLDLHRFADALASFDAALAQKPDDAVVTNNRGNALQGLRRWQEAVDSYSRALALRPGYAEALGNRGGALQQLKRPTAALADFEAALALDAGHPHAFGGAATAALSLCDWDRVDGFAVQMPGRIAAGEDIPPWPLLGYSDDPALQLRCAQNAITRRFPVMPQPLAKARYTHDRIRLGYLSSDFGNHPVTRQIAQLIEHHDRGRFEVHGFSTGADDNSAERRRIANAFEVFHDVKGQSPETIAQAIRGREIDILIDLNGHTQSDGFDILARRSAPVQAGWLGYAGTMGADFMDFCIADAVVAPDASAFSERLALLPHSFFPTDTSRVIGPTPRRADCGLPQASFVFCAFNQAWKFRRATFAIWMRLLAQVEGSVLWLRSAGEAESHLRAAAQRSGIDPARLVFAPHADADAHLARHAHADLFLDTLPYNAHATAADALWAGLPVLTCEGQSYAGRVASSLLQALEMPELVTRSAEEYEAMALSLARNPARLTALREKLLAKRTTAPLFDTPRLTRNLEAIYTALLTSPARA